MRSFIMLLLALLPGEGIFAQELFPATEPASNMPRHSIGFRTTAEGALTKQGNRFSPEVMVGVSKNLMMHGAIFYSDFYQPATRFEGFNLYAKYRFYSRDTVQKHFRAAAYGRYAKLRNPFRFEEINLEGDNAGLQGGIILTQLIHKLALSASGGYIQALDNGPYTAAPRTGRQINYSLSGGYLIFPKQYTGYTQTNMNLYLELLGKHDVNTGKYFVELAPAVQFIFGSRLRADFSKRAQLSGDMSRSAKNMWIVKLEYTLFNVW